MSTFYFILLPEIIVFGIVTNLLNVLVFLNPELEDQTFKYMLAISISDIFYLFFSLWNLTNFCSECTFQSSFLAQLISIYLNDFLTSSLALFNILIEIIISFQRYFILINKLFCLNVSLKLNLVILLMISLAYYFPLVFFKDIIVVSNYTLINDTTSSQVVFNYFAAKNDLGRSQIGKILPIAMTIGRIFLGIGVLTTINSLNIYEFRKRFLMKRSLKRLVHTTVTYSSNDSSQHQQPSPSIIILRRRTIAENKNLTKAFKSITLIVIWTCLLYLFGMAPFLIFYILEFIIQPSVDLTIFTHISNLILILSHGLTIFIYYHFNSLFRKILISYLRRVLIFFHLIKQN